MPRWLRTAYEQLPPVLASGIGGKLTSKAGLEKLRALPLSASLAAERDEWLRLLDQLEGQRKTVERQLQATAKADVRVQRLLTHPGIGPLTALCLVHVLGPIERFATTRRVAAYVGLRVDGPVLRREEAVWRDQ